MSTNLPADHIQRGWDSEVRHHRANLARAVEATRRHLDTIAADLAAGAEVSTHASRHLVIEASEVAQLVFGLHTAHQLRFALPEPPA